MRSLLELWGFELPSGATRLDGDVWAGGRVNRLALPFVVRIWILYFRQCTTSVHIRFILYCMSTMNLDTPRSYGMVSVVCNS